MSRSEGNQPAFLPSGSRPPVIPCRCLPAPALYLLPETESFLRHCWPRSRSAAAVHKPLYSHELPKALWQSAPHGSQPAAGWPSRKNQGAQGKDSQQAAERLGAESEPDSTLSRGLPLHIPLRFPALLLLYSFREHIYTPLRKPSPAVHPNLPCGGAAECEYPPSAYLPDNQSPRSDPEGRSL